jgi:hypothetical protein
MESLALLCTLHADGPASLRRLRRAGCDSIAHLERLAPGELASILEVPPAVARRLGREARGLSARLDPGSVDAGTLNDREEAPELGAGTEDAISTGPADVPTASAEGGASGLASAGLGRRDRALLDKVLGQWTQANQSGVTPPVRSAPPPPLVVDGLAETVEAETVEVVQPVEPETVEPESPPTLTGGEVDGLDGDLAAALAAAGINDLTGLVEADAVGLARTVARPFAQVRRVQFLARRALAAQPAQAQVQQPVEANLVESRPVESRPGTLRPATELELPVPRTPAPPTPEPAAEIPGGETSTQPRKFWEPRPQWAGDLGTTIPVEQPIPLPPEAPTPPAMPRVRRPRRPGRTLNWTFEVPAQPLKTQPSPEFPSPSAVRPGSEGAGPLGISGAAMVPMDPPEPQSVEPGSTPDEGVAGPFA